MEQSKVLLAIFKSLEKVEVKGYQNVVIMHDIFKFIEQEVAELERKIPKNKDIV